jgi:CBS domain-containing protein
MRVKEIMTSGPMCCAPDDSLQRAAEMMVSCDCGEIPVVDDLTTAVPVGVITDRDITCRTVAMGLNPLTMTVSEVMSTPVITVNSNDTVEDCCYLMEQNQIRRIPVVDDSGACVGIVSLADISRETSREDSGEVLQEVSAVSVPASNVT